RIVGAEGIDAEMHEPAARRVRPQSRNDDPRAVADVEPDLLDALGTALVPCLHDEPVRPVGQVARVEHEIRRQGAGDDRFRIVVQVDTDARRVHSFSSWRCSSPRMRYLGCRLSVSPGFKSIFSISAKQASVMAPATTMMTTLPSSGPAR